MAYLINECYATDNNIVPFCSPTQQGDRLSRLVQHVLAQQVLYPVSPPPDNVSVSPQLLHQHASLNCKPHVIVLPSDLRHYAKVSIEAAYIYLCALFGV